MVLIAICLNCCCSENIFRCKPSTIGQFILCLTGYVRKNLPKYSKGKTISGMIRRENDANLMDVENINIIPPKNSNVFLIARDKVDPATLCTRVVSAFILDTKSPVKFSQKNLDLKLIIFSNNSCLRSETNRSPSNVLNKNE